MSVLNTVFLTIGLLISGVSIPIILTFQNKQTVHDGDTTFLFTQPLLQTAMIFLGEIICISMIYLVTKAPSLCDRTMLDTVQQPSKSHTWSSILFIIPSGCDLIATTLLNLGLIYTSPSIYQMVKSSIVAFSAIFSALFFSRKFLRVEWIGIASVLAGTVVIVGSITHSVSDYKGPILLLVAQLFVACQFILEEYFMDRFQLDPIKAMGIEGIFGSVMLVVALLLGAVFGSGEFDIHKGVDQLLSHNALWQSALVLAVMVAIFNFFGLVVGSSIAIPGKSVIDTLRTVLTWLVAIYYGWDHFDWIQLSGFIVLIIGIYLFNGVFASCMPKRLNDERTPLLS